MIVFAYRILPALVIHTDRMPSRFAGFAFGPLVFIRPGRRGDAGLLAHELVHVRQFYRTLGLNGPLYLLSRRYRLRAEVEAFRAQLAKSPGMEKAFAQLLATRYRLGLSVEEAEERLGGHIRRRRSNL